ncbi:GNAT family N-acetyltransferase [Dictyobacter kobayashii]|uniref:Acetyltransferase n=1 Tax=Dictyobacter kobayashii TaxID=2014872 RepID=A0A402ABS1_9CHLR|nr:GNAT family N-acetyltransferase [Dictyobacter kobayashii]GCE16549.1 acetyltransferase [Dictyobacter kobayashii]
MAFLSAPSEDYQSSYLEALQEYRVEGRGREPSPEEVAANFDTFVQHLHNQADRTKIKPRQVPTSEFWLIDGNNYLGRIFLRHELDKELLQKGGHIGYTIRPSRRKQGYGKLILKYGLVQAKAFGFERVLLTCDEDNHSSRTIIESNGGILENTIQVREWPAMVCRYWIHL